MAVEDVVRIAISGKDRMIDQLRAKHEDLEAEVARLREENQAAVGMLSRQASLLLDMEADRDRLRAELARAEADLKPYMLQLGQSLRDQERLRGLLEEATIAIRTFEAMLAGMTLGVTSKDTLLEALRGLIAKLEAKS